MLSRLERSGYHMHHVKHLLFRDQERSVRGEAMLEVPQLRNVGVFRGEIRKGRGQMGRNLQPSTGPGYINRCLQPTAFHPPSFDLA